MKKLESTFSNMVIVLTVITVIAAACLGAMNNATIEPIAASKKAKQEEAIKAVLPQFTSIEEDSINEQQIFRAFNDNGELVGIAIKTSELGFGGDIISMVGIDANGTIVNYSLLQHAETPGLGSKLVDWFIVKSDIRGAKGENIPLRVSKDGGQYDAITAATISSRAFLNSINKAYETYQIARGETPTVDAWSGATTQTATDSIAPNSTDTTTVDTYSGATAQTDSLNSQLSTLN